MEPVRFVQCACGCGGTFQVKRWNQRYLSRAHKERAHNVRWPRLRLFADGVSDLNASRARQEPISVARTLAEDGPASTRAAKRGKSPQVSFGGLGTRLLRSRQVAELLGVSGWTLVRWRVFGEGPVFVRLTPRLIRYRYADVLAFLRLRREKGIRTNVPAWARRHTGKI